MADRVRAQGLSRARTLALREFPRPAISADDALLRIEACGICGSDNHAIAIAARKGRIVVAGLTHPGRHSKGRHACNTAQRGA